ncbi:unnamed protein product [Aphanomyces euteiches]
MDPYYQQQQQQMLMQDERERQQQSAVHMNNMYMQNPMAAVGMHHPSQHMNYPMAMPQGQPGMMLYPDSNVNTSYLAPSNAGAHMTMAPPVNSAYGYYDQTTSTNTTSSYDDIPLPEERGGKRHVPRSAHPAYKTPPQFLYLKDNGGSVASTESQMRNLKVDDTTSEDGSVASSAPAEEPPLDLGVLSKLLGKDPSQITGDQIRNILANPDLLNIYKKLQEEEQRKQKRLARNRDLAGARRKKSKELVETYEAEVKELQNILAKSLAHEFGKGDIATLVEALSGEHKQCVTMTKDTKHQETAALLTRLLRHASVVHDANDEALMLALAAADDPNFLELKLALGLTDLQCMQLFEIQTQVHNESTRLAIVEKCFAALNLHEWLHFPNTENLVDLFRAPLNEVQLQKFVQWTRVNSRVIQALQFAIEASVKDKDIIFDFPAEM